MTNSQTQNPIRVNHVGFTPETGKRFVLTDNKTGDDSFSVFWLYETEQEHPPKEVYSGKMILEDEELGLWSGDFSCVTQPGDYFIVAGGHTSRFFVIYDKAYDQLSHILLSYFTYQRCGSDLGWAGRCHLDDGFIKETGEKVDGILGGNIYDASHVNGVGQNQISHRPYGQFFPPVPHIPGAINIGFKGIEHTEYSEYDMPCVGMFMFLLSEYL